MSDIVELGCCDGVVVEVDRKVVMCMELLKPHLESFTGEIFIPLQKVESDALEKAVEWIQFHQAPEIFLAAKKAEKLALLKKASADELDDDNDDENPEEEFVYKEDDWRKEFFHVDQTTMMDIISAADELGIPGLLSKAIAFSAVYGITID